MKPKHWNKGKVLLLALSLSVVLSAAVGMTWSFLTAGPEEKENGFYPGGVTCQVHYQTDDDGTVRNVFVENTGNTAAYIRAYVVVNYEVYNEKKQRWEVMYETPALAVPQVGTTDTTVTGMVTGDFTGADQTTGSYYIKWGGLSDNVTASAEAGWCYQAVNSFFYNKWVEPQKSTPNLIVECGAGKALPEGYRLSFEFTASAIQAEGYDEYHRDIPALENWLDGTFVVGTDENGSTVTQTYEANVSYPERNAE